MRVSQLLALFLLLPPLVLAAPRVSVVALFNDKAMVEIDGRRQLLRTGQRTPEGVALVSATPRGAVLEIDGRRQAVGLSRSIGGQYSAPQARTVHINRDPRGMYTTTGSVNGVPMKFMVDTGASTIALNAQEARRAGIDFRVQGTRVGVRTASGETMGYRVDLRQVGVGGIVLPNVTAIVLEGAEPHVPLLGMSFLGRLKLRQEGQLMVLEQLN
jgi:aspartyl protease family protein